MGNERVPRALSGRMLALPFQAVIFDMDNVIADTELVYFESNQALFTSLGLSVSVDDYAQFFGMDAARMWAQIKGSYMLPHSVADLVRMEADAMIATLAETDLQPMPGLPALLDEFRAHGMQIALASSSTRRVIDTVLNKLALTGIFSPTVSGEDVRFGKPAPDIFLRTAELLDVRPADCLVIEDSANGVRAAKAAGMRCFGFRNPSSGVQDLSPADWIVDSLAAIKIENL